MSFLQLWLSNSTGPQLQKTLFQHHLLSAPCVSIRGKIGGAYQGVGTFQWTPSVQALCILLLESAAVRAEGGAGTPPVLSGERGTPASSLDFAIRKLPTWLSEMFGRDSKNRPLIRQLLTRTNPGQRHAGPTALRLSDSTWSELTIQVYMGERPVTDTAELSSLAQQLESAWHGISLPLRIAKEKQTEPPRVLTLRDALARAIREEVRHTLCITDIFTRQGYDQLACEIHSNPSFHALMGERASIIGEIDQKLLARGSLLSDLDPRNADDRSLYSDKPIKVWLAALPTAVSALFWYLKVVKGCSIELQTHFGFAGSMVDYLSQAPDGDRPDVLPLSIAAASRVLSNRALHFHPFCMIPKHGMRLMGAAVPHASDCAQRAGTVMHSCDVPTSPSFYFDKMLRRGVLDAHEVHPESATPQQMLNALDSGDPDVRAIALFPHYFFYQVLGRGSLLDGGWRSLSYGEGAALAHTEFLQDHARAYALHRALRAAWVELAEGGAALDLVVKAFMEDQRYIATLQNAAGMYKLDLDQPLDFGAPPLKAGTG